MLPRFMDDPRRAGHLAIQVVAEGEGLRMETLRQRLCAAQALDLVREYFDYLGTHSELEPRPDQQSVLARLDAFEKEECTPERSPPVQTRHMTLLSSAWWPHDLVPATSGLGSVTDLVQALHDGASPLTILLPTAPVSEASASQGDDPETD
jgi:hypothetical protein